jgi:hypothetical protein
VASIRALTRGPLHHFFGYYGVNAWDPTLAQHLALETTFHEHRPTARDRATVGLVEAATGAFRPLGVTPAFNLQQGSMMHWIDAGHGAECTYNDWTGERLVSRAVNPRTGAVRTLAPAAAAGDDGADISTAGAAIAAVSPTAPLAIGLNFARMSKCRAVVGYDLLPDASLGAPHPEDDGLWQIDLASGEARLFLSIADLVRALPDPRTREGAAWCNHVYFNPSGTRFVFLCRIRRAERWYDSLWTVGADGADLRCLLDYRYRTSHFMWMDDERLICSTDVLGRMQFVWLPDGPGEIVPAAEGVMPSNGHACFSPGGEWLVTDAFHDEGGVRMGELMLVRLADETKVPLGRFAHPPLFTGDIRCDLHPRWRPDGRAVTFDSVHEGSRQVYIAEVGDIVG